MDSNLAAISELEKRRRTTKEAVRELENLLGYKFRDSDILMDALTHPSFADAYRELPEVRTAFNDASFLGERALNLALATEGFFNFPNLTGGDLHNIRVANASKEKLARVAIRHKFFGYLHHKLPIDDVREFQEAISHEVEEDLYGAVVEAPRILSAVVKCILGAIFIDAGVLTSTHFDASFLNPHLGVLLNPIITKETLQQHPVTMLQHLCYKQKMKLEIQLGGDPIIAKVLVDGVLMASAEAKQEEVARRFAARIALQKLTIPSSSQSH